jgi:copper resistance protein B
MGLRLRYEIKREFAPYIGVRYEALYGETEDIAQRAGEATSSTNFVIGVRAWY